MCGICGKIDFNHKNVNPLTIQRMCEVLAHRGPDDEGMLFIHGDNLSEMRRPLLPSVSENSYEVGLGHRRLAIIDLSAAARQPMGNEDGTLWIVYNGEIYNFQDLKKQLQGKGHFFKSNSDTEVILHAYEEWGVECLQAFRGMFAFAIWDHRQKHLFMARDRLGKKPLVYMNKEGYFGFASEIKALLQIPEGDRQVNHPALHHYLTYQYVPSPDTIFEGIKKLPPAHYLLYDRSGKIKIERYWKLSFAPNKEPQRDISEWCHQIKSKLEESVKLRLISDVPLGAFLSGGVDSSLVVGIMTKLNRHPVKTFSIGFEEKDFDELSYARMVSKHFLTEHQEFIVKPNTVEILPKLVWHYNEPFADSSAIPTYYVAKMTKGYVKVVLTGDAGDENFAGYPRYLRSKWVALFSKIPERMRKNLLPSFLRVAGRLHWRQNTFNRLAAYLESMTLHQGRNYAEQVKIFNAEERRDLYSPEFNQTVKGTDPFVYLLGKYDEAGTDDLIDRLLSLDINTYLPEDLLVKVDIATMAHSLEARVPFLDHILMESVTEIPSPLKLKGTVTKFILKECYKEFLPEPIFRRKKMGFGVPVSRWFRNELKDYVREILMEPRTLHRGYFRKEGIERLIAEHLSLQYDHSAKIWALLFLEMWFRVFIDQGGTSFFYEA